MSFFENNRLKLKVERGKRVFPQSDKSINVLDTLINCMKDNKVEVVTEFDIKSVEKKGDLFLIEDKHGQVVESNSLIISTGGKSYPGTGSTGDGYKYAKKFGHTINKFYPSLAPILVSNQEVTELSGLSLKNVELKFFSKSKTKPFITKFGEMLFTHEGISGPIVLDMSNTVAKEIDKNPVVSASIDLKPALSNKQLMHRLNRDISDSPKSEYKSLLKLLLPKSLIDLAIKKTMIEEKRKDCRSFKG